MLIPEIAYTDVCSSLRNAAFSRGIPFPAVNFSHTAFTLAQLPSLTNPNDSMATQARQYGKSINAVRILKPAPAKIVVDVSGKVGYFMCIVNSQRSANRRWRHD
jgi:hypothetical protein